MWRTLIETVLLIAVTSTQRRDFKLSPANIVQETHLMPKQTLPNVDHVMRLAQSGIAELFICRLKGRMSLPQSILRAAALVGKLVRSC